MILGLLLFAGRVMADAAPMADTVVYRVKTYEYTPDLKLDVFAPEGASAPAAQPVIVLFHGGSWVSGDKAQMEGQCRYFARQGMVAVTANYRLQGKDTGIVDAKIAVRWVRGHARELGIDTAKMVLGGASAGGHLATMVVVAGIPARALVLFNPAYSTADDPAVEPYSRAGAGFPPTVFFYGSKDKWKPAGDSLRRQLKKAGVDCEMWVAEGQVHGFFNKAPWKEATCVKAQEFLARLGVMKAVEGAQEGNGGLSREDLR
jgi:acetyl esterase/lipase